jgi:hypothetical protein
MPNSHRPRELLCRNGRFFFEEESFRMYGHCFGGAKKKNRSKQYPTAAAPKSAPRQAQMKKGSRPRKPFFIGFMEESSRVYGYCFERPITKTRQLRAESGPRQPPARYIRCKWKDRPSTPGKTPPHAGPGPRGGGLCKPEYAKLSPGKHLTLLFSLTVFR